MLNINKKYYQRVLETKDGYQYNYDGSLGDAIKIWFLPVNCDLPKFCFGLSSDISIIFKKYLVRKQDESFCVGKVYFREVPKILYQVIGFISNEVKHLNFINIETGDIEMVVK